MATRLNHKSQATALYLYGITKQPVAISMDIDGVGGMPAEAMECAGFWCWVGRVSRKEFADNLSANSENLDWLTEASVRHQRVVAAVAELTEILPARFGTVFLSEASLEGHVREKKKILESDFRKIKGCDEWGVKVFSVERRPSVAVTTTKTGREYLQAKAAMREKRPAASDGELQQFSNQLKRIAVDTAEVGRLSEGQRGLQWQTSVLLKRQELKKFKALLKKIADSWAEEKRIECTGPWPPYSFVSRVPRGEESGV
ncbi:MAG: GvpL/GvpF family gas vesicle protein [Terriglobales bacterium]